MDNFMDKSLQVVGANVESGEETRLLQTNDRSCTCYFPKRYILVMFSFLGFVLCYAGRSTFTVAVVAMTSNHTNDNKTAHTTPDCDWDVELQGILLSVPFYGNIIAQVPLGYLTKKYGGKYIFVIGIMFISVVLLLTPLVSPWNVYAFIALRALQGFGESVVYPCAMELLANWIPTTETSKLCSLVFAGAYFGTLFTLPVCGALADSSARWPSIFYTFGGLGILWSIIWVLIIYERPADHPSISQEEHQYINDNAAMKFNQNHEKIPWCSILTSGPVWAISIGYCVENWGIFTWLSELPTYMDDVYHIKIKHIGLYSASPFLALALCSVFGGYIADSLRIKCSISTGIVRRIFSSGAYFLQAVMIVVTAHMTTPLTFIISVSIAVGIGGFAVAGTAVNALDISPEYSSVISGLNNAISCIPGVISPVVTGHIIHSGGAWTTVFYISAGMYVFGVIAYLILASGEKQKWSEKPPS